MSKILRRPMFRGGGKISSYGNGITTGLANGGMASKRGLVDGPGGYAGEMRGTLNPKKSLTSFDIGQGNLTGADIKKMAEEKVFSSPFKRDLYKGIAGTGDILENYVFQPLITGGDKAQDYFTGSKYGKDKKFFGEVDTIKKAYDEIVMPEAIKLSNELIPQISDEDYDEESEGVEIIGQIRDSDTGEIDYAKASSITGISFKGDEDINEIVLEYQEKINKDRDRETSMDYASIIDPREDYRSSQYDDGSLKALLNKQRLAEEEANRVKGGGQDASETDFEIPVGVTEMEGEQEIGFADMAEEYYNMMGAGADERMAARVAAQTEREDERIKRARGTDISNTLLKIFEGSQKEGATVGSSAAEGSKYLTSKESATEAAKRLKESRLDKLEDSSFNREEARRDRAGAMAFKDMMQDKQFDFSDLKSEKDFTNKMEMLKLQLDSADSIAEKRIIAARINTLETIKNKVFAKGITQKNVEYLMSLPDGGKKTAALIAAGFANNIYRQAENANNNYGEGAGGYTIDDVLAEGGIYFSDWGGVWKNDGSQGDGTYIIPGSKEILKIEGGTEIYRKTIAIA